MRGDLLALGGVAALAVVANRANRTRAGSPARRPPLDYDALADDFREFYATLGWAVNEEEELHRWARAHHITYLGAGSARAVFGVPTHGSRSGGALKIAFSRDNGFTSNRNEAEVWEDAPANLRPHLVPVLEHSGTEPGEGAWVLMERVKVSRRGKMSDEAVMRLSACGIQDIVGQNVSDDGRLIDYGWVYRDLWAKCTSPRTAPHGSRARVTLTPTRGADRQVTTLPLTHLARHVRHIAWADQPLRGLLGDLRKKGIRVEIDATHPLEARGARSFRPGELVHVRVLPTGEPPASSLLLEPRVPRFPHASEDQVTPRVSFAPDVPHALWGAQHAWLNDSSPREVAIYRTTETVEGAIPALLDVPDADITREVWALAPTRVALVGILPVAAWSALHALLSDGWREVKYLPEVPDSVFLGIQEYVNRHVVRVKKQRRKP